MSKMSWTVDQGAAGATFEDELSMQDLADHEARTEVARRLTNAATPTKQGE